MDYYDGNRNEAAAEEAARLEQIAKEQEATSSWPSLMTAL